MMEIVPYCGLPPLPIDIWSRWNLDPALIAGLCLAAAAYACGARLAQRQAQAMSTMEQGCFYAGWAIVAAALVSPLCALSVSLFSARIGQHMILTMIAAPLIMIGRPIAVFPYYWKWQFASSPCRQPAPPAGLAAGLFAALLWFWHAPVPYAATFASPVIYWAMHLTLFGSALWLWNILLDSSPQAAPQVLGTSLFTSVQMGFLGALLTFAPRSLYTPHLLTTSVWNLTPLQDQQMGGVIMWVPGCLIIAVIGSLVLGRMLERLGSRTVVQTQ